MLTWLIHRKLAKFEQRYGYDLTYARELLATDLGAFLRLGKITNAIGWHRDVPLDVYYGAKLTGTVAEDCGPCTQLVVTMALADKVDPRIVAAIVAGDEDAAGDAAVGVRFARAVLAHSPEADSPREEIERRWGKRAVVSCAFALTAAKFFPTLKYALGHGRACQQVLVAGTTVSPRAALTLAS
jgi:hypothetical protein